MSYHFEVSHKIGASDDHANSMRQLHGHLWIDGELIACYRSDAYVLLALAIKTPPVLVWVGDSRRPTHAGPQLVFTHAPLGFRAQAAPLI